MPICETFLKCTSEMCTPCITYINTPLATARRICCSGFSVGRSRNNSLARPRGTPAVDIAAMTSSSHVTSPVTSPIDSARPLSYRLPTVMSKQPPYSFRHSVKNRHKTRTQTRTTCQTPPRYTSRPDPEEEPPVPPGRGGGGGGSRCSGASCYVWKNFFF